VTIQTKPSDIILLISRLLNQQKLALSSLIIMLMLNSKFLQMTEDVLQLSIFLPAVLSTEIIQPGDLVENEVDDG
jgi:hypothetical protein